MSPTDRSIRVLIVDDSALIRKLLADLLRSAPDVEVVGSAKDGEAAISEAKRLCPDVVTLDVNMPGRSGLEILPDLLAAHPAAVLMVSSLTQVGADVTLAALDRGAIDFFPKPDRNQLSLLREAREQLVAKVRGAAQASPARRSASRVPPPPSAPVEAPARRPPPDPGPEPSEPEPTPGPRPGRTAVACVVVGISTGGPQALGAVLPLLAPPFPPFLIVQHMPAMFTAVFAERLDRTCAVTVKEAAEGDKLLPDRILIAPGGRQMSVIGSAASARVKLTDDPAVSGHKPSIDVLFTSAARVYGAALAGFLMTGMGRDGVAGCKAVLAAGGQTFGQDEATSAVYGMNKAAFLEDVIGAQFPLEGFPALFKKVVRV